MARGDLADAVESVIQTDSSSFKAAAADEADQILAYVNKGVFDNSQPIIGLEFEFYAINDPDSSALEWKTDQQAPFEEILATDPSIEQSADGTKASHGSLARVPQRLRELIGFEKELGLHNVELNSRPQPLNQYGLAAQQAEIMAQLVSAQECVAGEGLRLVSDGMWTIPPEGESAMDYLTASVNDHGIHIASNMAPVVRYHAMSNATGPARPRMRVETPQASFSAETVMPECLATSIQPHYQVPVASDLPLYFNYALRVAGPLLALGVNSPFLPPECYDTIPTASTLEDGWMANRIPIFESVLNADGGPSKVRFPRDIPDIETALQRIVDDPVIVPMEVSRGGRFDDEFATFRRKHGTYWRWVRPVFEGSTRSAAHARIEFRPVGAQPTIADTLAIQATFAGLLESLPKREHPLIHLSWDRARENFYAAMQDGLDADFTWITNDGRETTQTDRLFESLFDHAEAGLTDRGIPPKVAEKTINPLRARIEAEVTPASWKHQQVREHLTEGMDFKPAVEAMQRTYFDRQEQTLFEGSFADWIVTD